MPGYSTSLAKPFRHSTLNFFLIKDFSSFGGLQASLNSLPDEDVILDLLVGGVLGQAIEDASDFFFGQSHERILPRFSQADEWPVLPSDPEGSGGSQLRQRIAPRDVIDERSCEQPSGARHVQTGSCRAEGAVLMNRGVKKR